MALSKLHTEVEFEGRNFTCTVVPYDRRNKDQKREAHRLPGIWTMLPDDVCYSRDRYTACPALRYVEDDGYYYMVCVEAFPKARYAPYIYRTRDFVTWEIGLHNPILWISKEDRMIKEGVTFDEATTSLIHSYLNINNCDVDFCEYQGKTIISYLTGDQLGTGFMCEAVYDGPLNQFLQAFFR